MKNHLILWSVLTALVCLIAAPFFSPFAESFIERNPAFDNPFIFQGDPIQTLTALYSQYYVGLLDGSENIELFLMELLGIGLLVACGLLLESSSCQYSVAAKSILGNAHIIETPHARAKRNDTWNGKRKPKSAGLVYGFENGHYIYESQTPHQVTIARTGGGKSRYSMLETVHLGLEAACNLIISDLKNEIIELTGERADQVSNVVIYDLEDPLKGNRYNPLDIIVDCAEKGNISHMRQEADKLAANLVPTEDKNPFFSNAARGLLAACFIAVATADIDRSKKNMASVCTMIDEGSTGEGKDPSAALKDFFRSLGHDHPAFSSASEFLSDGGTTAGKNVLSTAKVALRPFSSPAIRWMTAKSDPSLDDLITNRTTLYIHVLSKDHPANCLLGCFFSQWWTRVQEIGNANGGSIPIKTKMILDEFGNFPKIPLADIVTLGRSYGVSWYGYLQSIAQLALYNRPGDGGAGSREILANVGVKVALSLSEKADRDYFTELVGKRGVMTRSTSSQKSAGRISSGNSSSERADDVIHSWEWNNFSPDDDGAIVIKAKENGVKQRSGVFRMPLVDATKTPAKQYFDLGGREHERQKRMQYAEKLNKKASHEDIDDVDVWHINFDECMGDGHKQEAIENDEFSAWDMEC